MADSIDRTFRFADSASPPFNAIALVYDLQGFSKFFNQPDVQDYVPQFLNIVSKAMAIVIFGGTPYWSEEKENLEAVPLKVIHEKFMGDGALYILSPPEGQSTFDDVAIGSLCNRLWNLKKNFDAVLRASFETVPVVEVPRRIRFGLSRGSIYELDSVYAGKQEHIGFCINLASRLQGYCPDLGFIASARVRIPDQFLLEHEYRRVVATRIKGFPNEIVFVDDAEYSALDAATKKELFEDLPV